MPDSKSAVITVAGLIEQASEKITARDVLVEEVAGLREMLRLLDKAGQTTPEESEWIAQAFPVRETLKAVRARAEARGVEFTDDMDKETILALLGEAPANGDGE